MDIDDLRIIRRLAMIYRLKELLRCDVVAVDGIIGRVADVYFDDETWTIRYLVVDTGRWLNERQILVSPYAVRRVWPDDRSIGLTLNCLQVERSPDMGSDRPVSRQYEKAFVDYYKYPAYWSQITPTHHGPWSAMPTPDTNGWQPQPPDGEAVLREAPVGTTHLRSFWEVSDYHLQASDGRIGHAEHAIFDDRDWSIRFVAAARENRFAGRSVLIAPCLIDGINWPQRIVKVLMTSTQLERIPQYDPNQISLADYELTLRGYLH